MAALLVLLGTLGGMVAVTGSSLVSRAQRPLLAELERQLPGLTVEGGLAVGGLHQAVLRDVRFFVGDAASGELEVIVPEVAVRFDPIDLLRGTWSPDAIAQVELRKPSLRLRAGPDGAMPWDTLFDRTGSGGSGRLPFPIRIVGGEISVDGMLPGQTLAVSAMDATLRPSGGSGVAVAARARLFDALWTVSGTWPLDPNVASALSVEVAALPLSPLATAAVDWRAGRGEGRRDPASAASPGLAWPEMLHGASLSGVWQVSVAPRQWDVRGTVRAEGVAGGELRATVRWQDGAVHVEDLTWAPLSAPAASGLAALWGPLTRGKSSGALDGAAPRVTGALTLQPGSGGWDTAVLAGSLRAQAVPLAALGRLLSDDANPDRLPPDAGTVDGAWVIGGSLQAPAVEGALSWQVKRGVMGIPAEFSGRAHVRWDPSALWVDELSASLDGVRIVGSASWREGRWAGRLELPAVSLEQLVAWMGPAAVRLRGAAGTLAVSAALGGTFDAPVADLTVRAPQGVRMFGLHFSSLAGTARVTGGKAPLADITALSLRRGPAELRGQGRVHLQPPYAWDLSLALSGLPAEELPALIRAVSSESPEPAIAQEATDVPSDLSAKLLPTPGVPPWRRAITELRGPDVPTLPAWNGSSPWDGGGEPGSGQGGSSPAGAARGGDAGFSGVAPRIAVPPTFQLRGILAATVRLTGTVTQPELRGSLRLDEGRWRVYAAGAAPPPAAPALSGRADVRYAEGVLRLEDVRVEAGESVLHGSGWLELGGRHALAIESAASLDMRTVLAAWSGLPPITGQAAVQVQVGGTLDAPRARLVWEMGPGRVDAVLVDGAVLRALLEGGVLHIEAFTLQRGPHRLQVQGTVPVPWLGKRSPLHLTVQVPKGPVDLVAALVPGLSAPRGTVQIDAVLDGTLDRPSVHGTVAIEGADIAHGALPVPIRALQGQIAFRGTHVSLQAVTASVGGGRVRLNGQATLQSGGLRATELDLQASVDAAALAVGGLASTVSGQLDVHGPLGAPLIRGRLLLDRGQLTLGRAGAGTGAWPAKLDVALETNSDFRIVGPGIDISAAGRLHAGGTLAVPRLSGEAQAVRGRFDYLGTEFRVREGRATFQEFLGIIPTIDARAEARVRGTRVEMHLTGPADRLSHSLQSDPPLSASEIMALLEVPSRISRLAERPGGGSAEYELIGWVQEQIGQQVTSRLEQAIRDLLAVDDLQIRTNGQGRTAEVAVGKYLTEEVYATYTQRWQAGVPSHELGVEYRLTPQWRLRAQVTSAGDVELGVAATIRF